jgi:DNA-binding response OmpR family regulator
MNRPLVLVVEDDDVLRGPMEKFLTLHGFDVVSAESVIEASALLARRPVQAAVVDLRLRQGSGRDVVLSIPPPAPVIIFSGMPGESAGLEEIRPNTRLVLKPFSLALLAEMLQTMLNAVAGLDPGAPSSAG